MLHTLALHPFRKFASGDGAVKSITNTVEEHFH